ncbi:hypothetical protein FACS189454_02330 [Planctomycetales bacterium]|nr:hypothetical protein FACS189454_02330 [Planctomycetales bacterium]
MLKGNAILGQSGGPTSVINASLCGIIQESLKQSDCIENVLGMRFGIEGFLRDEVINLGKEHPETIEQLKTTPSSALGSCRHKLRDDELPKVLEYLKKYNIRYYFLIGGNDTMDTIHRVEKYCREQGYELRGVGVPKTVDNDLFATDHTPGFASAARFVVMSVKQSGMLARDMKRVDQFVVFQTVGRSAGWLPAAAACAKKNDDDAPHIILLPERPFIKEQFFAEAKAAYDKYGWVSVVCGEGVCYADGRPISATQTTDKFGNNEFGAMGGTSAAMVLHQMLSNEFGWRGEFQICESLQMCAADRSVPQDITEAHSCGQEAVRLAVSGISGVMVSIRRDSDSPYKWSLTTAPLADVANGEKPMPDEFICSDRLFVTDACLGYLRPLIGELPDYTRFDAVKYVSNYTSVIFERRMEKRTVSSPNPADVWTDWKGKDETWLFLAAHDDDIVTGAGLTFLSGLHLGVNVYAGVISNGRMGYCTPEQKKTIAQVRREETQESFKYLGLPKENLYQFDYDDGNLPQESGRRFADNLNDSRAICGAVGLQNTLTWLIRQVKPTRIFVMNRRDLHPDHRAVNSELSISIFHAQGGIWPELGPSIKQLPQLYEYPTYSDFIAPPTIRVRVSDDLAEKRLQAIAMFKSQLQIELLVEGLRKAGGNEYLFEMAFDIIPPGKYNSIF